MSYEPANVILRGHVRGSFGYGPPGFGENPNTDSKERFLMLALPSPVCVSGGAPGSTDEDVSGVSELQLVFVYPAVAPDNLNDADVEVSGQLFHRISGGHAIVLVRVGSIRVQR